MTRNLRVIPLQMSLRSLSVALALALTAGCALVAQTPVQKTTSITHVTVVDVATGKKLPDQTVDLQGDRILSVSTFDSAAGLPPNSSSTAAFSTRTNSWSASCSAPVCLCLQVPTP
jgi:hypothetical protein